MKHLTGSQTYRQPDNGDNSTSGEYIAAGEPSRNERDNPCAFARPPFPARPRRRRFYRGIHRTSAPLIILWDEPDQLTHPYDFEAEDVEQNSHRQLSKNPHK